MEGRVLLGMNCSLAPAPEALATWIKAQNYAESKGINVELQLYQMTANSYLIDHSLINDVVNKKRFSHLMWASDDTIPSEDIIVRLVNDDKDIISGVYRTRDPNTPTLAVWGGDTESFNKYLEDGAVIEREFSSGHSLLMKQEVVSAVYDAHPELDFVTAEGVTIRSLFMPFIRDKKIYLNDWAFCQRAKDLGFKCWVDFGVKLNHKCFVWLGF